MYPHTHTYTHMQKRKHVCVRSHTQIIDIYFAIVTTTAKWKPLEMATLLQLLQPVESSWKELAVNLLSEELQHRVNVIEADCFHNDASQKALDDVFSKWLERTVGPQRTWQTLSDTAKKYGDNSLAQYIQENDELNSEL